MPSALLLMELDELLAGDDVCAVVGTHNAPIAGVDHVVEEQVERALFGLFGAGLMKVFGGTLAGSTPVQGSLSCGSKERMRWEVPSSSTEKSFSVKPPF